MKELNVIKRMVSLILVCFMLTLNVFAEETCNVSYRIEMENEQNTTVEETELNGDVDNSNLNVQVIKKKGDEETVIYTGTLGGYDNGNWINTDFSDIQFLVLFDWEGAEDEALYIVPINEDSSANTETVNAMVDNEVSLLSVEAETNEPKYSIKQAIIKTVIIS